MGLSRLLLVSFLGLVLAGCASAPAVRTEAPVTSGPDYLSGVRSEYSVPISSLGDVELLGGDSVMRDALVAGDRDLLVAASAFRVGGVLTLDLIVLNKTGESVELSRGDLNFFDADGRLLSQVDDVADGIAWGLRGRGHRAGENGGVDGEVPFGTTWSIDQQRLGAETAPTQPAAITSKYQKYEKKPVDEERRERTGLRGVDAADVIVSPTTELSRSPRSVRVRPDDGKAFWAYFEGGEIAYPVTAMVMIGGEQYVFRFEG